MWETDGTVPRQEMLLQLCEFFNVSADYLLGNDRTNEILISSRAIQTFPFSMDSVIEELSGIVVKDYGELAWVSLSPYLP